MVVELTHITLHLSLIIISILVQTSVSTALVAPSDRVANKVLIVSWLGSVE